MKFLHFKLSFYILIFTFYIWLPQIADAALIIQRPLYIGLTSGLVGYWSFNGPDMSGNTAYDRSGQGNNGTLVNGPQRTIGKIGQALSFDGVNDYVRIPDSPSLDITTPFTVLAWIYPTKLNVDQKIFHHQSPGIKLSIYSNNKVEVEIRNPSNTAYLNRNVAGGTVLEANRWYFIGGWWDGSELRSIVNGQFERPYSYSGQIGTTTNDAGIGTEYSFNSYFFNGLIDEVRIYNRALSASEIKRLYNIGATFKINKPSYAGLENGLVGYWSFNGPDMSGNTAYDRSGQGNNGTLVNGPQRTIGKIGQALSFDGVDDYVDTGFTTNLTSWTVAVWTKSPSPPSAAAASGPVHREKNFQINWNHDNASFRGTVALNVGGTWYGASFGTLNGNTWYHLVGTYDGEALRAYKDGVLITENTSPSGNPSSETASLKFGRRAAGTWYFNGIIDEVRIYNRALSADEIKRLYNIGR